jgi:hypothetical protein
VDNSFAGWAAAQGLDEAHAAPDAVLNPAGIPNLLVYALSGGDPRTATGAILPVPSTVTEEGMKYFCLTFLRNPEAIGVDYVGEYSADLRVGWTTEGVIMEPLDDNYWRIRAPVPMEDGRSQFLRLKVVIP